MVGDNADTLAGWQMPPRCCGEWLDSNVCRICSNYVTLPPNIELGTE